MARTVFISGCNRGIGREAVRLFAEQGDNLICCIRKENEEFNAFIANLCAKYCVEIECVYCDMADEASIKSAIQPLLKAKRQIDVLINNAGIVKNSLFHMTTLEDIRNVFQINFFSHVLITQYILKLMKRQNSGCVINVASIGGIEAYPAYVAYGCSKASIIYLTKTLSQEFAQFGIRVNAIAPGMTDTSMSVQMGDAANKEILNRTAMKRLATHHEIAPVMVFLASEEASFINGQTIRVDGGM